MDVGGGEGGGGGGDRVNFNFLTFVVGGLPKSGKCEKGGRRVQILVIF